MWDILWMLRMTIQTGESGSEVRFPVIFAAAGNRRTTVTLKSICGPGDDPAPCITIMFEDED
jgi:hypothetical protein